MSSTILAANSYGKSRVRMIKVARHAGLHDLADLTIDIRFEGDFETAHTAGDNSRILPTDTMKNTVYALAMDGPEVEQIEEFALRLARYFLDRNPQVTRVGIDIAERLWNRLAPYAFSAGGERRTCAVEAGREASAVVSGIDNLVVLKTTGSAFEGFIRDRYTTLRETSDRILATAVRATWTYARPDAAYGPSWVGVRRILLETFAAHDSRSVQHTAYAMGEAVLASYDGMIDEIRLRMPNQHCLLVDLAPFGLANDNRIFQPVDEPHGLIEVTLKKDLPVSLA